MSKTTSSLRAGPISRWHGVGFVLLIVVLLAVAGRAQGAPGADDYVTSAKPNTNFGSNASLAVQSPGTMAFIRIHE